MTQRQRKFTFGIDGVEITHDALIEGVKFSVSMGKNLL